ncbi:hypothetical protein GIB67_014883 [Kingdonia uniflora]|uniref:Uncharacterized protein n=1 Tax=Kingdonia uniflora TaxID=39325 RepID=A0A7J7MT34_9MAGN|nr:hypothetical protein GIB67_014883 [Kingdonia uniflora]
MRTRRSSRLRLIDVEIEENEASMSGRALIDEGNDVEELVIIKDISLAVVVLEIGASNSRHRKTVVTKDSGAEEMERGESERREGWVEPLGDKRGEGEPSDHSEDSTESDEAIGSVSAREKQRLDRFMVKFELSKAEKGKGKVFPESPWAQQPKVTHRKRRRALGKDDAKDVDKELTVSEWEEQARDKDASMAELCSTDQDKALIRMKKSMYQIDSWVQALNKAQKVVIRQLKQAADKLALARGTDASLLSEIGILKQDLGTIRDECERRLEAQRYTHTQVLEVKVAEKDWVIVKQKETFQGQFDKECVTNVRLKEFIEDLGYDPETFQCLPMNLRYGPVADDVVRTEWAEVNVVGVGTGVEDGAETLMVHKVAATTIPEGVMGADGSNP